MKLRITITMDNAAFDPNNGTEAASILKRLANLIDASNLKDGWRQNMVDSNGNTAAEAKVSRR